MVEGCGERGLFLFGQFQLKGLQWKREEVAEVEFQ